MKERRLKIFVVVMVATMMFLGYMGYQGAKPTNGSNEELDGIQWSMPLNDEFEFVYENPTDEETWIAEDHDNNVTWIIDKTGKKISQYYGNDLNIPDNPKAEQYDYIVSDGLDGYIGKWKKGEELHVDEFLDKDLNVRYEESTFLTAEPFSDGLALVEKIDTETRQTHSEYINPNGETVIKYDYPLIGGNFSEGIAIICDEGKCYRAINKKGETVFTIPFEKDLTGFYKCGTYNGGYASVMATDEKKFGYMDKSGNLVIDYLFDYATECQDGYAAVWYKGMYGIIKVQ